MTAKPTELPVFIQMKYRESGVFSTLKSDVANVTGVVRRDFQDMAATVDRSFQQAIGASRQAMGSLGLDDMRRAVELQQAKTRAAEEYAAAARRAAAADAGQTRELQQAAQAAEAMAEEQRRAAAAAAMHADVLARVEHELQSEASAATSAMAAYRKLAGANDNAARSAGSHRMAMVGLGQQLQDSIIQAQMGTSALTIFAQQGSQAAFQMAGMGGKVGAVASVMAGPWGAAIFGGTALLGPLIAGLFKTSDALDEVKFASDGVTTAQGILGNVLDLATGKVTTQRGALLALAEAQILVNKVQAQQRATEARRDVLAIQDRPVRFSGGGLGGGFTGGRRPIDARDTISRDVLAGALDAKTAIERLDNLRKAGRLTGDEFNQAAAAVANLNLELENIQSFDKADALLNGRGGRDLLKPAKATKPKADHSAERAAREAEQVKRFSDQAADAVARITERFDAAPKAIDQAAQATRKLEDVIADIDARLAKGGVGKQVSADLAKARADAEAAKQTIADSLVRPLEDARRETEQRLTVQAALARGNQDEAAALEAVYRLEQQLGDEEALRLQVQKLIGQGRNEEARTLQRLVDMYPEMKRETAALAVLDERRTRELRRQQDLFEAQIDVLDTAKRSLTDLLSGRSTNFFGDMKQAIMDLQGKRLFDSLFGDVFRDLEAELRGESPLGKESKALAGEMHVATLATDDLVAAFRQGASSIRAAGASVAANDNAMMARAAGIDPSLIDGNEIAVTRSRVSRTAEPIELKKLSAQQLADMTARGIVTPLTAKLDEVLGTSFFQGLNGTLAGAMAGYMTGGAPGGILGGLKGIVDQTGIFGGSSGGLSGALGKGMGGAQTGTMAAGIMKSLGLKTSTTGAQIGGAIGSFIPIPGGEIIGSAVGGLLGGLFKKTKKGYADNITVSADGRASYQLAGNNSARKEVAGGLADDLGEALYRIADQLGGGLNSSLNLGSLGQRKNKFTFDPTPGQKAGRREFASQEEAVRAALEYAIDRGVITGIRNSTQHLLQQGKDLDKALQDALDWEGAFKELKRYKDPLGAALDGLDDEFEKLIDLAKQAGASTEEYAQLEELYGIKRAEIIKEQSENLIGTLRSLYKDLTIGDNGLSLRDRRAAALTDYSGLASRVAAGDNTAYDDYAEAARALLDIERELYGSQQQYFDRFNEVTALTKSRIDAETNVVSIAENRDSPFDATGAVRSSIDTQTDVLSSQLEALNINAGATIAALARIEAAISATGIRSAGAKITFAGRY